MWHKYYNSRKACTKKAEDIFGILESISMARKIDLLAHARLCITVPLIYAYLCQRTHGQYKREH
jgi:hypothetical protein